MASGSSGAIFQQWYKLFQVSKMSGETFSQSDWYYQFH